MALSAPSFTTQDALRTEQRRETPELAAILVEDTAICRAFEAALQSLGLQVVALDLDDLRREKLVEYELIVADEGTATTLRPILDMSQSTAEVLRPALVAVGPRLPDGAEHDFDAYVAVPSMMSEVTSRLSVILYSHRALARRYQSALEELHLNRNIFRSVTNGISVANAQMPDLPLMYVNPSFELMTGYTLEEVQGKNCRFLQGQDADQPGLTLVREAIAQQRQTVAILRNYRKDGTCFWNELTLSPIFNRAGELTHFVGIQLDVTDRVRVESALRESEKLAAVGRLASSISHEINNPLEAVTNLVYLARETLPNQNADEARGYLDTADDELRRVKQITSQSLRFARQNTRPAAVLANDAITSVVDVYRARLRNYGVEVRTRLRSTQHVVVYEGELRQVLSNLINNAIDALKTGEHRLLLLRTREATDYRNDRTGVLITVADNGTGIPRESLQQIFEAFYSTKGLGGTGLGLWITKGILDRHHGTLRVRSATGTGRSGTVFQIFVPFQAAVALEQQDGPDEADS